jgi:signal transduction histidine kinase/ActR/RegA family two-component response regulator
MPFVTPAFRKSPFIISLVLGAAGFVLNRSGLRIFGGSEIFFGVWPALLAVYWLGPWWGAGATALASASLWLLEGHPTALLCFTLEAVVVGWCKHRHQQRPLVVAALYWLLVGTPLAACLVLRDGRLPFPDNGAEILRYPVNSLVLAFAVLPVFRASAFRRWAGLPLNSDARTPLQQVLFRRIGLIIALSLAIMSLIAGRLLERSLRASTEEELVADSRELAKLLERFLQKHEQAVRQLASANRVTAVARYSLQPQLETMRKVYPAFLTALAADESGRIVAVSSSGRADAGPILNVADREYFRQPLATTEPYLSGVFRGRGFGSNLIVAISAPLMTPARRPIGVIEASLDLREMLTDLAESGQLEGRSAVIVDRQGRVVACHGELHRSTLADFRRDPWYRQGRLTAEPVVFFADGLEGAQETFIGARHVVPGYRWEIYLAEPAWRSQRVIAGYFLGTLLGGFLATGLALWLIRSTAREITEPLNHLVLSIKDLSRPDSDAVAPAPIAPVSRELTELTRELHTAALALSCTNRELANTVADRDQTQENLRGLLLHLEDLVRERTLELDEARRAAESANEAKTDFLASMSHELRTPLNVIVGMSELVSEQTLGPLNPRQQEGLQNIHESGRHLLDLINDILDLSKIEAGQLQLDCQPMDVADICAASVRFVREAARRKDIRIETGVAPGLPATLADARRVKQILVNLLANAVKFTAAGGRIGLEARVDEAAGRLHFDVWDTGIGIAPENFERIFQPFQQIDSSLSRQYAGTGLGLALVRRMVQLHGGTIGVQSEPGRGSRFTATLPWHPESACPLAAAAPTPETIAPFAGDPLRVLIAEDNDANRQVYAMYFTKRRCEVVYAANGREAIDLALTWRPDVVLMDVHMPVMDGLEAMRHLRADARTEHLPVIAVTALAMPEDRLRCIEAGANAYLTKPINLREFGRTLARFAPARCAAPEPVSVA